MAKTDEEKPEWERRMERARRLHRPSLKDWQRDNMYEAFPPFVEKLASGENYQSYFSEPETPWAKEQQMLSIPSILDAQHVTREDFHKFERERIPCVLKNIVAGHDGGEFVGPWGAGDKWTFDKLRADPVLSERKFKCGEDDDERNIKIRLSTFLQYVEKNRDDSPLYVFDTSFDDDDQAKRILSDYRVPSYFRDDLFGLISESRRPPYRWWLVGPERSGTCVHIDPLATSAWNTLIVGQKRWVLFPPHVQKSVVKGNGLVRDDEDDEAIHYFMYILPRIKRKAESLRGTPKYKNFCCYEFTQNPGETCYIPQGWWHAVLNLTDTVAVTQNFASPRNFDNVWLKTRSGRKRMAWKWLGQLEEKYPELANRAKELNKRDNYTMKYDPTEIERREREEKRRKDERKRRKDIEKQKQLEDRLNWVRSQVRSTTHETGKQSATSSEKACSRQCDVDSKRQRTVSP